MSGQININRLSRYQKLNLYFETVISAPNKEALFSDGTELYRSPCEPQFHDTVTLRIRTGKDNIDSVVLVTSKERVPMTLGREEDLFDYYEAQIQVEKEKVEYYFEITAGPMTCVYNSCGVMDEDKPEFRFSIMPGFKTPDWAKGAVFYQIFVDRFYNGDTSNDVETGEYCYIGEQVKQVKDWNKLPDAMGVREFYGGDLQGVYKKLDYLQDLGIEAIYLNPIFVSPSNHKYDIQDYDYVDPHFGVILNQEGDLLPPGVKENKRATKYISKVTSKENLEASNEFFIKFVEEVHKRGMKVILDGVFNHCGSFNKWMDRERIYESEEGYALGAYVARQSPYHTFFKFYDTQWPYNGKYDGWWGHDTLPKLNYEDSEELFNDVMRIARKWVSAPYNVDGWRLDVAADLGHSSEFNHKFWKRFREEVKSANPEAIILAEHYGDPSSWLQGDEWDTVMNYDAFMEPISWFLTGVEKHSDEFSDELFGNAQIFENFMIQNMAKLNTQSIQTSMNELSNHDHSRFLTRTNHKVGRTSSVGAHRASEGINKGIMREAVVMQMTWPGAPTVYYGDEAGVCGWTDPDNRRTYPWGNEDQNLIDLHKEMIRIHKDYNALKRGSVMFLGGDKHFISYGRFDMEDHFVIAVNNSEVKKCVELPVWKIGIQDHMMLASLIATNADGYSLNATIYHSINGMLSLTIEPFSAVVIKNLKN